MSVAPATDRSPSQQHSARLSHGWPGWLLTLMALNVTVAAVYGGIGLIRDTLGMGQDWLDTTPFDSWVWPGVALLTTVALPQFVLLLLSLTGSRWAIPAGYLMGAGLIGWIVVQVLVMQRYFVLQPVVVSFGLIEVALAALWARHARRAGRRSEGAARVGG